MREQWQAAGVGYVFSSVHVFRLRRAHMGTVYSANIGLILFIHRELL